MTQVDFAIITIREDEFEAVLQRFPVDAEKGTSGRIYGTCEVQTKTGDNCRVAVVRSSIQGNDAAQEVANDVISDLNPQMLLVVGIAGGVPSEDFTLGDVIVSTGIDNLNVSKRREDGKEEFDLRSGIHPDISNITAGLLLYKKAMAGWNDPASITLDRPEVDLEQFEKEEMKKKLAGRNSSWYQKLQKCITAQLGNNKNSIRSPRFVTGTIASSNSVVRNIDLLVQWLQTARSILALEMESAGVYQAAQKIRQQYPVMAIRGISDIVGLERDNQWTKYACQTAAAFAYAFVTAGIVQPRATTTVTSAPASASPSPAQKSAQSSMTQNGKQADGTGSINIFISYVDEDEKFKKHLETHLAPLKRDGTIRLLYNQQVKGYQERKSEIANYIDSARIIILLVSPSFLASDQIYKEEIMRAMERRAENAAWVVPIFVRHVAPRNLAASPFGNLQGLPRGGKPVEAWRNNPDEVWASIAEEIEEACVELRAKQGN